MAAITVFTAALVLYTSGRGDAGRWGGAGAAGLALLTWWALNRSPGRRLLRGDDPVFWQDLAFTAVLWLGTALLTLTPAELWSFSPDGPGFARRERAAAVLHTLSFVGLYLAVERQPHRRHRWRRLALERRLTQLTVWLVVVALISYLMLGTVTGGTVTGGGPEESAWIVRGGALLFGGYLTVRLIALVRVSTSRRWRRIYTILAATMAVVFFGDLARAAATREPWSSILGWWAAALPLAGLLVAARARHLVASIDFSKMPSRRAGRHPRVELEENLPGPLGQTMIFAVLLPGFHYLASMAGWLEPEARPRRETVLLVAILLLGTLALYQHRLLARAMGQLRGEYARSARRLHEVERDIRAHSRRQKERATLSASQQAFARAFQACPDVIAIAEQRDARLVDVNARFFELFGFSRHEAIGRTLGELGVWAEKDSFTERLRGLRDEAAARVFEGRIRQKSGRQGQGLFFAEAIEIDDQPYLLVMVRDVTRSQDYRRELEDNAGLLERARAAIVAADSKGEVAFWNAAAERLFGVAAGEALGRRLGDIAGAAELSTHADAEAVRTWLTELIAPDSTGRVEARAIPVLGRFAQRPSTLFVLTPAAENRGPDEDRCHG